MMHSSKRSISYLEQNNIRDDPLGIAPECILIRVDYFNYFATQLDAIHGT
jgi:hypothetical protein